MNYALSECTGHIFRVTVSNAVSMDMHAIKA